nr:DEAD/DEAH box helicase [Corynebacterium lactis]
MQMAADVALLLHAFWKDDSGLHLWVERPEGHRIVASVDPLELPSEQRRLFAVLERGSSATVSLKLRTPKGRSVERVVPTWVFPPWEAVRVLAALQEETYSPAMAPDLRFFVDVVRGMEQFARSGRALIGLTWEDRQWWPTWRMPEGLSEIAWRSQVAQRTPPVLIENGGATVAEDFMNRMFHWTVNALLSDLDEPAPQRQSFVRALLESEALDRALPGVASALSKWRSSADSEDARLLMAVEEPTNFEGQLEETPDLGLPQLVDIAREDSVNAPTAEASGIMWPLRMYFRVGVMAPERLNPDMCRRSVLAILRPQLQRAQEAFPPFTQAQAAGYGLDLMLTSEQLIELVSTGIAELAKVGIDVMLPANWKSVATELRLNTRVPDIEPTGPAGRRSEPKLGFNQLVDYEWKLAVGDMVLNESEMRQLAASSTGLVYLRDRWVHADPAVAREALKFLVEQTKAGEETGKGQVSLKELVFADGIERKAPVPVAPRDPGWLRCLVEGNGSRQASEEDVKVPSEFVGQLRPYQIRGLAWLSRMSESGFGVILADDMGLGKTIQILALLQREREENPQASASLLVAPTGVLRNWASEAKKFTPDLRVGILHGSGRPSGDKLQEFVAGHDLIVTTYGVATRDRAELGAISWEHVIADEAQAIKNPNSQASRALRAMRSRQNIAMTGTPVENDLGELRAIMDFCNPGMLGSANVFRNRFAIPIERDGNEVMLAQLRALTAPFILRRMKSDPSIAPDLPKKNEHVEMVTLTAEQAFLYEGAVKDLEAKIKRAKQSKSGEFGRKSIILSGIMKLKQICNHPAHYQHDGSGLLDHGKHRSGKVERLEELLDDIVAAGERALVFTQFVEFGKMLVPYLSGRFGQEIPFIEGSMTPNQRERAVAEFNSPGGAPVMILSTLAAGVGINLTTANHVIHVDRWWNPAVENQATDRSYRIGQVKDVHVHKLVSVGTLEERIDELIFEKSELADAVVRAGETKLTEMDFHRLRSLWQLDHSRIEGVKKAQHFAAQERRGAVGDGKGTPEADRIDNVRPFRRKGQ